MANLRPKHKEANCIPRELVSHQTPISLLGVWPARLLADYPPSELKIPGSPWDL